MEESVEDMNDQDGCENQTEDIMVDDSNSLLLQFQCLGTSDREALIQEFQRLLAPMQLSVEGCTFFLEMNNWNLQQAICSYFDYDAPRDMLDQGSLPSMVLIKDVTIGEGEEIPPCTKFIKTWRIQNPGPNQWPLGCSLRFLSGAQLTNVDRVIVEPLHSGQTGDISVEMVSPAQPGTYEGQWRMTSANGMFFGGGLLGLTQQMSSFDHLGSTTNTRTSTSVQQQPSPADSNSSLRNPFGMSNPTQSNSSSLLASRLMCNMTNQTSESNEMLDAQMNGAVGQVNVNGIADGSPLVIHNLNIDRLKARPADDNQENCFKICNDVLTRSPVSETRRSSFGRSFSLSQSPSQSSLQLGHSQNDPVSSKMQPQSSGDNSMNPPAASPTANINQGIASTSSTQFPPTPPSEDMML